MFGILRLLWDACADLFGLVTSVTHWTDIKHLPGPAPLLLEGNTVVNWTMSLPLWSVWSGRWDILTKESWIHAQFQPWWVLWWGSLCGPCRSCRDETRGAGGGLSQTCQRVNAFPWKWYLGPNLTDEKKWNVVFNNV